MEDEIKINEYVRANNKGIKRIDRIDNNKTVNKYLYFTGIEDFEGKEYGIIKTTEIVKHSKQLIDLIEVGDIVNGYTLVGEFWGEDDNNLYFQAQSEKGYIGEKNIKTILTHEQYEEHCFKVGEE